jgi:hypothetical protein
LVVAPVEDTAVLEGDVVAGVAAVDGAVVTARAFVVPKAMRPRRDEIVIIVCFIA